MVRYSTTKYVFMVEIHQRILTYVAGNLYVRKLDLLLVMSKCH